MSLVLITAPPVYPITNQQIWDHLRVPLVNSPAEPVDKDYITTLLAAATAHLDARDGILGRCLVEQTWELRLDMFPVTDLMLPLPPIQSVSSVKYIDEDGVEQTFASSKYEVDTSSWAAGWIAPVEGEAWPATKDTFNAVKVRYVAGYAKTSDSPPDYRANVPDDIKSAIKLIVDHWYNQRGVVSVGGSVSEIPYSAKAILDKYRIRGFG